MIQPNPWLHNLPQYIPGKHGKTSDAVILSANENPFGPPKGVRDVFEQAFDILGRYPDGGAQILRKKIAQKYQFPLDNIACGAGSDELISLICNAFLQQGDAAIYSEYGFLMYPLAIQAAGANVIKVPEKHYKTDLPAILAAITAQTKLIFLANPNNPTGYLIPKPELQDFIDNLPKHVLCVLDGAYIEYIEDTAYQDYIYQLAHHEQVIITQTFSKIYGLAALRIGWMAASTAITQYINRIRGPFNCNQVALMAASTALDDADFVTTMRRHVVVEKARMQQVLQGLNFVEAILPSQGNFLLMLCKDAHIANNCLQYLEAQHCFVRAMGAYNIAHGLRVTVGKEQENNMLIAHMQNFHQQAQV